MERMLPPIALTTLALVATAGLAGAAILVVEVPPGSAGELAGLRAGDEVVAWRGRGPMPGVAGGEVGDPFDWAVVELEVAPRGGASVDVRRQPGGNVVVLPLPAGRTEAVVAPAGDRPLVGPWRRARAAVADASDDAPAEVAALASTAADVAERSPPGTRWWLEMETARLWVRLRGTDAAEAALGRAAAAARDAGAPAAEILARLDLAVLMRRQRRYEDADRVLADAERVAGRAWPDGSVCLGEVVDRRGESARGLGHPDRARRLFERGLELRRSAAPGSLDEALSHNSLCALAYQQGRLEDAVRWCTVALEIRQRTVPGGLEVAKSHNNLGLVSFDIGDLAEADRHLRLALEIKRRRSGAGLTLANTVNNLALVASARGDLESAQRFLEQTVEIERAAGAHAVDLARTFNNLGEVALKRGQWGTARRVLERSLELHRTVEPPTIHAAYAHANLGFALAEIGDLEGAGANYRAAAGVIEEVAPDSLDEAKIATNLADLEWRRGDLAAAERGYRSALALKRRLAAGSIAEASGRAALAGVLLDLGDVSEAREELEAALAVVVRLAPGTDLHARVLHKVGRAALAKGDRRGAIAAWRSALDALDEQVGRVGVGESLRAGLRSTAADIPRDLVRLLVDSGEPARAFEVLERWRAQELGAMLRQREVALSRLPAELERRRRTTSVELERAREALADADPGNAGGVETAMLRVAEARRRWQSVADEIRTVAPLEASLRDPRSVDGRAATDCLGSRAVGLAYMFDDRSGLVFAVGPGDRLEVRSLEPSRTEIARRVTMFRGLVAGGADVAAIRAAGAAVYRDLVAPVEDVVEAAELVVLIPDDPLLVLPWAALVREGPGGGRWLAEWRPTVTAPSLTVLAALRAGAPGPARGPAVAVADPSPAPDTDRSGLAGWSQRLPAARDEVEAVRPALGGPVAALIGTAATEVELKRRAEGASLVHLATHAVLDDRRPLESAVVLAPSPSSVPPEDGLLHAWEVMGSIRLDRALVVLSGCDTGLGRPLSGEGLIGLSRAFHHAGARSVLASLWRVEDRRAAELMRRFYRHLGEGEAAAVALRSAQVEMIRGRAEPRDLLSRAADLVRGTGDAGMSARSHPTSWAALRLEGDWR